jgi:hypothetical protein
MKGLYLRAILVVFLLPVTTEATAWRGITPLQSTRTDVERLLGRPKRVANYWATYHTATEVVTVFYSNGRQCGAGTNSAWDVPKNRVISITVVPKTIVLFSTLELDQSRYVKKKDPHKLNAVDYLNEEDGESINVVHGEITSFRYFAGSARSHLKCPKAQ